MRDKECLLVQLNVLLASRDSKRPGRALRSQAGVKQNWTRFLCSPSHIKFTERKKGR